MRATIKHALLGAGLLGVGFSHTLAANTMQMTFYGEITQKTCEFQQTSSNVITMQTKEVKDFDKVTDVDGVTSENLLFVCAPDLPIKVTVTDRAAQATNRAYLSNKTTGQCNNKICATNVGVKVRFYAQDGQRQGSDSNLGTPIVLRAAPSQPNYYKSLQNTMFTVRGFYTKINGKMPTPGGVEAQALFTFAYQ